MYFVIRNQFGRAVVCPTVGAFWRWILDLETREVEEHMKYRHSFLQVLAAGLTVATALCVDARVHFSQSI